MTVSISARTRSPWQTYVHKLGKRREGFYGGISYYDTNVRYVLEDIAVQLGRIADALEGKQADS